MSACGFFLFLLVGLTAAAMACGGSQGQVPTANSVATLTVALEAAGLQVSGPLTNDVLSSRYFSVPGVSLKASGETVYAYEFGSDEVAAQERLIVSDDGYGIGSKYINWETTPSFYKSGRLIVIYDGNTSLMEDTLASAMGARFAGSEPES